MSFMFNPYPYDDPNAVNHIDAGEEIKSAVSQGSVVSAQKVASKIGELLKKRKTCVIGIEGYISAPIAEFAALLRTQCAQKGIETAEESGIGLFLSEDELDKKLASYLPNDRENDPVLLYGKLYHDGYEGLFNSDSVTGLKHKIKEFQNDGSGVLIVYGNGVMTSELFPLFDLKLYIDVTQKRAVLNIRAGKCGNLGSSKRGVYGELLRRSYYIDFEAASALRGSRIKNGDIDYYLAGDKPDDIKMISAPALIALFETMTQYPLRCRPVYLEGVWGGYYIKRLRDLPKEMKNCAWVFDLIPMEVSIVADMDGLQMEFPFYFFVQCVGEQLMGRLAAEKFSGYFPIRFNYDDTFHSSGNMSVQVHPDEKYVKANNDELGRQDESYYVVATGHGAKTYIGLKNEADADGFFVKARRAEQEGIGFNHDEYIHSVPSAPGKQFMLPAGTIHASGRNQVILEIGSLTMGSYTYKLYDYMRKDLDGNLRPIHLKHGENVLRRDYRRDWVMENLVQAPREIRSGDGWSEYIVGQHELLYFSLRNAVFEKRYEDAATDRFHVLVLVDGEKCLIRSLNDPNRFFVQKYLDMVVIPANFGPYEVVNLGVGVVTLHKTLLKEGFENE
jgi:mannose-6-phosphate isomerase class I